MFQSGRVIFIWLFLAGLGVTESYSPPAVSVIESDTVVYEREVFYITESPNKNKDPASVKEKDADIKLRCYELKDRGTNDIMWQFKRCGYALSLTACDDLPGNSPWQRVKCRNGTKFCEGVTLPIVKPTELDSGIYRCVHKNYIEQRYRVNRVIQLEVRDPQTKSMEVLPEGPDVDVQTIFENQTAVLRCRVRSLGYPHIMWARYVSSVQSPSTVSIGGVLYQFLNASQPHEGPDKTYTSKLHLSSVSVSDAGQYICFALDGRHNLSKIVILNVVPFLSQHRDPAIIIGEIWWITVVLFVSATTCILILCVFLRKTRRKLIEVPSVDLEEKSVQPQSLC